MDIDLPAGRYVVAVSGGVDSIVLLHLLAQMKSDSLIVQSSDSRAANKTIQLTVAHFDHGIRKDSAEDRKLVQALAKKYNLPFVYHAGKLGPKTSEATARKARYDFLHTVRRAGDAQTIITAHHQDDVLETAVLNLLRGTGRRGLSSLKSTDIVKRPLLHVSKKELLRYAKREGLQWREDSTNIDERYLRNYIRHRLLPRFANADREVLLQIVERAEGTNKLLDVELTNYLHVQPTSTSLSRTQFILLPHLVAREVLAAWLLANTNAQLSKQLLERLVVAAKTGKIGSKVDVDTEYWLCISREHLALKVRER